jgi:two-component system response regulator MtrA
MEHMRARILVVDDDPALAEMLTIVLRGEGFDSAVVRDGSRALDAFREVRPDLVLLDLMLPGLSGLDVC